MNVAVIKEDQMQFVGEIQRITDEVVEGLIQFKQHSDPEETQGGHRGTAIVTADQMVEILKMSEDDDSDNDDDDDGV